MDQKQEEQLLKNMLEHPAGYNIGLLGLLEIRSLNDGTFAVRWALDNEKIFKSVDDAVECFLDLREKEQLGIDYEAPDIIQDITDFWICYGEVIDYNQTTGIAIGKSNNARYSFSSACFFSKSCKLPDVGDKVRMFLSKNHSEVVMVRLVEIDNV